MKYRVEPRVSFPHEFDIWDVKKGSMWFASFAIEEDAEEYTKIKNKSK